MCLVNDFILIIQIYIYIPKFHNSMNLNYHNYQFKLINFLNSLPQNFNSTNHKFIIFL